MRCWRLTSARHAGEALSGRGAALRGGRWNPPGTAVVYLASALSLAILEQLVHVGAADLWPTDLVALAVDLPDDLSRSTIEPTHLPRDWRSARPPPGLATLGARWVAEGKSALLMVPSAVVPQEWNVLLNPAHADAARLRAGGAEPVHLDPRLRR